LRSFAPLPAGGSAGDSAAMLAAAQAKLSFETEPNPPRKGSNTFRVRLTDAGGMPISGAEVSVTFVMPAMPAMGMAEMRVESKLADDGNGNYHGTGSLGSAGTWQVTLTAQRAGQVIANRQMSLNATGGL
jgi:membrane fusion protein, copper/silver efflux system